MLRGTPPEGEEVSPRGATDSPWRLAADADAREAPQAAEAPAAGGSRRRRRPPRRRGRHHPALSRAGVGTALALAAAVAIVVAAVIAQRQDDQGPGGGRVAVRPPSPQSPAVSAVTRTLAGLPQVGGTLGASSAPAKLTIFARVDGPGFATFAREVLPELVRRFVRPGRLMLSLRTLSSPTSSKEAAQLAQAAGLQTRLWPFVLILATGDYSGPAAAARAVPGLQSDRLLNDAGSARVASALAKAQRLAAAAGARTPPAYRLTTAGDTRRLPASADSEAFVRSVASALPPS